METFPLEFFDLISNFDFLQFLNESNTTISPDRLKIKVIQGIFKQNIKPKCQIKWEEQYGVILIGHKVGQN
jgi:hypothetical protein